MSRSRWGTALATLLLLVLAPPAQGAGVVAGRLINKTPGGQAVGSVEVSFSRWDGAQDQDTRGVRTDRQGRFRFEGVSTGPDLRYRVTVRYQGAEYTAGPVSPDEGKVSEVVIQVWDGTGDPAKIQVARHHVIAEAAPEGLKVQEFLVVRNLGDRTFVGNRPVSGDRRATLQFTLARGYEAVEYGEGLMECCVVPTEEGFVDTMDVKPGNREMAFTYHLRPGAGRYTIVRRLDYPTEEVDLFVAPATLGVSSESLSDLGTISGQGQQYRRWGRGRLEKGTVLAVGLAGLPVQRFQWKWLVYLGVAALIGGGFAYPFIRRRRRLATALTAAIVPHPVPSRVELELRKAELVAGLASLDEQYEAGRIPEADYRQLRAAKKATLAEVMRALEI